VNPRETDALRGVVLDARMTFTLTEFCQACGVEQSLVVEMVDQGVIEPAGHDDDWHFGGNELVRAQRALRLVGDLGLNWPGAALAVELLERLEHLEAHAPAPGPDPNGYSSSNAEAAR